MATKFFIATLALRTAVLRTVVLQKGYRTVASALRRTNCRKAKGLADQLVNAGGKAKLRLLEQALALLLDKSQLGADLAAERLEELKKQSTQRLLDHEKAQLWTLLLQNWRHRLAREARISIATGNWKELASVRRRLLQSLQPHATRMEPTPATKPKPEISDCFRPTRKDLRKLAIDWMIRCCNRQDWATPPDLRESSRARLIAPTEQLPRLMQIDCHGIPLGIQRFDRIKRLRVKRTFIPGTWVEYAPNAGAFNPTTGHAPAKLVTYNLPKVDWKESEDIEDWTWYARMLLQGLKDLTHVAPGILAMDCWYRANELETWMDRAEDMDNVWDFPGQSVVLEQERFLAMERKRLPKWTATQQLLAPELKAVAPRAGYSVPEEDRDLVTEAGLLLVEPKATRNCWIKKCFAPVQYGTGKKNYCREHGLELAVKLVNNLR
jgi:hypothetical protein